MIRLTAVIEIEGHAPRALTYESANRTIILGRDPDADFQIPLSTVSRQHARISEADHVYMVEDLGSTHGTLHNGHKLSKGEKRVLRHGDVLEITKAKVTCTIQEEKIVSAEPGEGTQAIAARAVQGILGRLGDGKDDGPYLRVLTGADEGVRFLFAGPLSEWSLGRSKECEFILNDPNVSRRHATIKKDWSGFWVHDLGSKNGVLVNDKPIAKPRRLEDRDEIIIGPVRLVYVDPNAELMAALKDVPGFELKGQSDPAIDPNQPANLGAPEDSSSDATPIEEDEEQVEESEPVASQPPAAEPEPTPEVDEDLLKDESPGSLEWIVIAIAVAILVVAVFILAGLMT